MCAPARGGRHFPALKSALAFRGLLRVGSAFPRLSHKNPDLAPRRKKKRAKVLERTLPRGACPSMAPLRAGLRSSKQKPFARIVCSEPHRKLTELDRNIESARSSRRFRVVSGDPGRPGESRDCDSWRGCASVEVRTVFTPLEWISCFAFESTQPQLFPHPSPSTRSPRPSCNRQRTPL